MLRGDKEKERDRRQSKEGETPHACLRIVYPLFISQNLKIIPHLIPPLAAAPPPCFIHVAINKEQKTVYCKVTHRMRTKGRQYTPSPSCPFTHKSNCTISLTQMFVLVIITNISLIHVFIFSIVINITYFKNKS